MNQKKNKTKLPKYEDLPILSWFMAECVCENPYTGLEWSLRFRDQDMINRVEEKRKVMTAKDMDAFIKYADTWCKDAYAAKAEWMVKIALDKTNKGRDQLRAFMSHWLCSWLMKKPCNINIPV